MELNYTAQMLKEIHMKLTLTSTSFHFYTSLLEPKSLLSFVSASFSYLTYFTPEDFTGNSVPLGASTTVMIYCRFLLLHTYK